MTRILISDKQLEYFLAMDYWEFDQNEKGWRSLLGDTNTDADYDSITAVIEHYLAARQDMVLSQRSLVCFHAGQTNAFAGNVEKAFLWFKQSFDEDKPDWNAYTRATIAFLERDIESLQHERSVIFDIPGQMNLNIVDKLIKNFNKNYLEAYNH